MLSQVALLAFGMEATIETAVVAPATTAMEAVIATVAVATTPTTLSLCRIGVATAAAAIMAMGSLEETAANVVEP